MKTKVLLVEDDISTLKTTAANLKFKFDILEATTVDDAERIINEGAVDVIVTDIDFKGQTKDGLHLIKWTMEHHPLLPIIVVTGHKDDLRRLVEAQRKVTDDFITKPYPPQELAMAIVKARDRVQKLKNDTSTRKFREVITQDAIVMGALEQIKKIMSCENKVGICLYGESGVGKEELAKFAASVCGGPCVSINMSAITETLAESALFGHRKGSFSGAMTDAIGKFQAANGGILFLDEIGDCPLDIQAKLLRAIQEREIVRVGSNTPEKVDVRIIAATNKNLPQLVKEGKFREDLLHRIEVFAVNIPPLRERKADIPLLIAKFLNDLGPKTKSVMISPGALEALCKYDWPGNVRELRSTIEYALVQSYSKDIGIEHLKKNIADPNAVSDIAAIPHVNDFDFNFDRNVETTERNLILRAINSANGSRKKAMELLGLSNTTFFRKIKELNINL